MVLQEEIEKVQNRAAKFVTSNYCFETGSMTGILKNLDRCLSEKGGETVGLYSCTKVLRVLSAFQEMTLFPHHSFAFQIPTARTDINKGSIFPQTIRD